MSTNPTALTPPASPVAESIPRQGATLGAASAPVSVDVWEDYQCPYCRIWSTQLEPQVITDFVATGAARYQFHDFAFLGSGHTPDESLNAAVAASCAGDQGKFWPYHDWLYANQNPSGENGGWFSRARLDAIAQQVGLVQATFDTCLADPAKASAVLAERTAGIALGVNATPTIFVNGTAQAQLTYAAIAAAIRAAEPTSSASPGASPAVSPAASSSP